jgi:hypothetical protein
VRLTNCLSGRKVPNKKCEFNKNLTKEPLAKLLKQGGFRLRRGGVTVLK